MTHDRFNIGIHIPDLKVIKSFTPRTHFKIKDPNVNTFAVVFVICIDADVT